MKVIGIAASPRQGGNSQKLVECVLAGAEDAGAETELIRLGDRNIHPCIACGYCKSGHDTCAQKDDMVALYETIRAADVIVFGAPIYFARLNAQAYSLIDRLYAMLNPDFSSRLPAGKKIVIVLTCGSGDLSVAAPMYAYLKMVFGFFHCMDGGFIWQNQLFAPADLEKFPDEIAKAKALGRTLLG
ncbi:MAG: flavodoxin family protein [Methanocalculaceae archaeon]|jgi:multimeric flavodoxin WrbA|nr:flavodoxin family protein [Methanocalculaceae archaeon]